MQKRGFLYSATACFCLQVFHFLVVDPHQKKDGECDGCDLCNGEGPPYGIQSQCLCQDPCGGQQYQKLSGHGDDQAVNAISQSLEDGAEDDTEAGKNVA